MQVKSVVLMGALALGAAGAQANTVDWNNHDVLEIGVNFVSGVFTDYFLFDIAPDALNVTSTAVANNLGNGFILNIDDGLYSVWSAGADLGIGGGDDVKLTADFSFDGQSGNGYHSVALNPGSYYYMVSGNGNGSLGGSYMLTSTIAPVPEPESAAMLLAGLGMLGFLARRRRQD